MRTETGAIRFASAFFQQSLAGRFYGQNRHLSETMCLPCPFAARLTERTDGYSQFLIFWLPSVFFTDPKDAGRKVGRPSHTRARVTKI